MFRILIINGQKIGILFRKTSVAIEQAQVTYNGAVLTVISLLLGFLLLCWHNDLLLFTKYKDIL